MFNYGSQFNDVASYQRWVNSVQGNENNQPTREETMPRSSPPPYHHTTFTEAVRAISETSASPPPYHHTTYEYNSAAAGWQVPYHPIPYQPHAWTTAHPLHAWTTTHPLHAWTTTHPQHAWQGGYGHDETASTNKIRIVSGWDAKSCVLDCIAMVAKVSYAKARQASIDAVSFRPGEKGMSFSNAQQVLKHLGVKSDRYDQGDDWSDFPDLAIVTVACSDGVSHAVVFSRENGKELIYDGNNLRRGPTSCDEYQLDSDAEYLEIL